MEIKLKMLFSGKMRVLKYKGEKVKEKGDCFAKNAVTRGEQVTGICRLIEAQIEMSYSDPFRFIR